MRTAQMANGSTWIWCAKCGAHTSSRVRDLGRPCKGRENTAQLRWLEQGRHPVTGEDEAMTARDMLWSDVDAVSLLQACADIGGDNGSDEEAAREDYARRVFADNEADVGDWRSTWGIGAGDADDALLDLGHSL